MRRPSLPLLIAVLALSACGDAGQRATDAERADEQATAKAAGLGAEDAPSGWKVTPVQGTPELVDDCRGFEEAEDDRTALASAPDFDDPEERFSVQDGIYLFPDAEAAQNAFEDMRGGDADACIAKDFRTVVEQQSSLEVGDHETEPLEVAPVSDDVYGERIRIALGDGEATVEVTMDVVLLRAGRGISFLVFTGQEEPFDDALRAQLTQVAGKRLAAGAG